MTTVNKKGKKLETANQEATIQNYIKSQLLDSFELNNYSRQFAQSGDVGAGVAAHATVTGIVTLELNSNFFIGNSGIAISAIADQDVFPAVFTCELFLNGVKLLDIANQYGGTSPLVIDDFKNCKIIKQAYSNKFEIRYSFVQRVFGHSAGFDILLNGFWY